MKDTFLHIGYPKCASTALQVNFFSNHPELFYLGPYSGGMSFGWYNKDFKNLVEIDWRLMKDFGYDRTRASRIINACYRDFEASGKKKFGFSFESLAFTMHHDIDVTQKAQRLADIFGRDTRIIIITRSQFDLIRSLYREMIGAGLSCSFNQFISDAFYNKFRSFIYDFNFFRMYNLYVHHFGKENVLLLPYEYLKRDPKYFFRTLSDHIGVTCTIRGIPHENESLGDAYYEHFRELNAAFRHGMDLPINSPVAQFRYDEYFPEVEGVPPPPNAGLEKELHPLLSDSARKLSRGSSLKIQYDMPAFMEKWLKAYYGESNARLAQTLNLPLRKLGYPV